MFVDAIYCLCCFYELVSVVHQLLPHVALPLAFFKQSFADFIDLNLVIFQKFLHPHTLPSFFFLHQLPPILFSKAVNIFGEPIILISPFCSF